MTLRGLLFSALMVLLSMIAVGAQANPLSFDQWVDDVRAEALAKGIPESVVSEALDGIQYDDAVIALDQKQPEDKATFTQYIKHAVNDKRIAKGRALMAENRQLLNEISRAYHVQPQYIVALWGIETDYGAHQGQHNIVQSLATLAYDGRRADFFHDELMKALQIMATYHIPAGALTGSWAGAMGNCQFMPSSYLNFAVDWDRDGTPDIWHSNADTFASIANYLHQSGWDDHQGWGQPVIVPDDFSTSESDLKQPQTASYWRKRGMQYGSDDQGRPQMLLDTDQKLYAVTYDDTIGNGVDLVTENYQVLLKWNRSRLFATSVGMLADELVR